MSQDESVKVDPGQGDSKAPETAPKPGESGADQAPKKKKLSLDIEEIGEVLERKISP